jgi:hypothetical protein
MIAAAGIVGGLLAGVHHRENVRPTPHRAVAAPGTKTTTSGAPVRWSQEAIDVVVDQSFTDLAGPGVYGAAVDAWRATGAVLPSISTHPGQGRKVGYDPHGSNENVVVYAPYGWAKANGALAVTVLTFDDMSGAIVDADVLLNGGGRYFSVFDKDESDPSSRGISIEGSGGSDDGESTVAEADSIRTSRFDVQNVLTHELGHFLGLGEDFQDSKATMYASTRPGETNKRIVSSGDQGVVSALYAQSMATLGAQSQAGCGGAKLARGAMPSGAGFVGFGAATVGLLLLVASRRRPGLRPVPVRSRSKRSARGGLARFGGWLTVASTFALLSPPDLEAAPADQATRGDAEVQVTGATPRWSEGILETELRVRVMACHVRHCPTDEQKFTALGGHLGGVTQVVGASAVPEVGARAAVRLRADRSPLSFFHPNQSLLP